MLGLGGGMLFVEYRISKREFSMAWVCPHYVKKSTCKKRCKNY